MATSGRMNSVSYTPGTAPVGELRGLDGVGHRYGQRRTVSKQQKLILMRKCKRYYSFHNWQPTDKIRKFFWLWTRAGK